MLFRSSWLASSSAAEGVAVARARCARSLAGSNTGIATSAATMKTGPLTVPPAGGECHPRAAGTERPVGRAPLSNDEADRQGKKCSHDDVEDSQSATLMEDMLDGGAERQP